MPYPTDNPLDGQGRAEGGEVAAGRAAMPADDWIVRADWIEAEDGTIVCLKPDAPLRDSQAKWPARRPLIAAAPTMLAALRLALPELREDLELLVEELGGTATWSANMALPHGIDIEMRSLAEQKKAAHDAVVAAIAAAEGAR